MIRESECHPSAGNHLVFGVEGTMNKSGLPLMPHVEYVSQKVEAGRLLYVDSEIAAEFNNLLYQNMRLAAPNIDKAESNLTASIRDPETFTAVAFNLDRIVGAVSGVVQKGNVGWVEDLMIDTSVEDRIVVGPLLSELHDWFRRNGVQQVRMVVDREYAPSLLETYGYARMYGFDIYEKPLLHRTEASSSSMHGITKEKSVNIHTALGEVAIQILPTGKKSLITPPDNYEYANNVMRKLEVWLGSKDVDTARYMAGVNNPPFPGYVSADKILYSNTLDN